MSVYIAAAKNDPVLAVENEWFDAVFVELATEIGGVASQFASKIGSRDIPFAEGCDGGLVDHQPAFGGLCGLRSSTQVACVDQVADCCGIDPELTGSFRHADRTN